MPLLQQKYSVFCVFYVFGLISYYYLQVKNDLNIIQNQYYQFLQKVYLTHTSVYILVIHGLDNI